MLRLYIRVYRRHSSGNAITYTQPANGTGENSAIYGERRLETETARRLRSHAQNHRGKGGLREVAKLDRHASHAKNHNHGGNAANDTIRLH